MQYFYCIGKCSPFGDLFKNKEENYRYIIICTILYTLLEFAYVDTYIHYVRIYKSFYRWYED